MGVSARGAASRIFQLGTGRTYRAPGPLVGLIVKPAPHAEEVAHVSCVWVVSQLHGRTRQCNVKLGKAGYTMGSFVHFATFDSSTLASGSVLAHGVLGGAGLGIVSGACLHRVEALYDGIRGLWYYWVRRKDSSLLYFLPGPRRDFACPL